MTLAWLPTFADRLRWTRRPSPRPQAREQAAAVTADEEAPTRRVLAAALPVLLWRP